MRLCGRVERACVLVRHRVVDAQADGHGAPARRTALVVTQQEALRVDEPRRIVQQAAALAHGFAREAERAFTQVAQPAMGPALDERDELPQAKSRASTSITSKPRRAASSATPAPAMPPPITSRSTSVIGRPPSCGLRCDRLRAAGRRSMQGPRLASHAPGCAAFAAVVSRSATRRTLRVPMKNAAPRARLDLARGQRRRNDLHRHAHRDAGAGERETTALAHSTSPSRLPRAITPCGSNSRTIAAMADMPVAPFSAASQRA